MRNSRYKIVFIGDSGVGKTSLIIRYTANNYSADYESTVGIDFLVKTVIHNGEHHRLQLWDTAGQEKFETLIPSYMRSAMGVVMCYDVSNIQSFENIEKRWISKLKEHEAIILVGCKSDTMNYNVPDEAGLALAKKYNFMFTTCSAKSGQNVESIFLQLLNKILQKQAVSAQNQAIKNVNIVNLRENKVLKNSKTGCC